MMMKKMKITAMESLNGSGLSVNSLPTIVTRTAMASLIEQRLRFFFGQGSSNLEHISLCWL